MIKRVKKKHREFKSYVRKYNDQLYFTFRVLVGLLFLQYGIQKIFGMLGGTQVPIGSLFGVAGMIELVGGILITIGLFTQYVALIAAIEMLAAFFIVHISKGVVPIINGGNPALLFLAAFLVLLVYGARKWGLDNYFKK